MQKYILSVSGMHCASCKMIIERILEKEAEITDPHVDLTRETLTFTSDSSESLLIQKLNNLLSPLGYAVSHEKIYTEKNTEILWTAVPIGLAFLLGFFLLTKSGILDFGIGGNISPITSFLIGMIASVSSCLALVGGLILSLSAEISQENAKKGKGAIFFFHTGRILGFALLGGLLGWLGERLAPSFTFSAILGILCAIVMILLGLHLAGILRKNIFTLPTGIFSHLTKKNGIAYMPILIGVATFFLPCGFTQSMQIASLASGSFLSGAMIMLAFALGTFPVLALLSFSSVSFSQSRFAPLFFASAGVIVIGLGIFSLLASLAGLGIIAPLF